jgi:DNA-binding transcriptional ArsR family regulator
MVNSSGRLDQSFLALAHPIRRGIVERLAQGPATVGAATGDFGVSKPAITRHLRVLEDAGVVQRSVVGRTHRLSLRSDPLADASDWMARQRELWERKFDTVGQFLDEQKGRQRDDRRNSGRDRSPARAHVRRPAR